MARASLKVTGDGEMMRNMRDMAAGFPSRVKEALRAEAEIIMREAKLKHVPVDDGPLRASGHVQPARVEGDEVIVTMAFGGASAPYALAVHEHPSRHSPPSWRGKGISDIRSVRTRTPWNVADGRGPKYLDRPMKRVIRSGTLEKNLARRLSIERRVRPVGGSTS